MTKFHELLKSRKFWAALVGLLFVIVKGYAPTFPLSEEQVTTLVALLASYILGTGIEAAARR